MLKKTSHLVGFVLVWTSLHTNRLYKLPLDAGEML